MTDKNPAKAAGIKKDIVKEIIDIAVKNKIHKVILFGSRARGDFCRASDIDLAVEGENVDSFIEEVKETVATLLEFDIVDLKQPIQETFRNTIEKEGIILYEEVR